MRDIQDMSTSFQVPAAKHLRSGFESEPERWSNVTQTQALHQKTPHRYQQSPVFTRKANGSSGGQSHERSRHRHHSAHHNNLWRQHIEHNHHHHQHAHRRRRGNSEGDKVNIAPEEKVHLLSELPWRKSGDFSEAMSQDFNDVSVPSIPRMNVPACSPTLPRRYENSPNFQRERTWSVPTEKKPIFARRGKQRAKSQDCTLLNQPNVLDLPLDIFRSQMQYTGSLVIGVQAIADSRQVLSPQTPDTPLVDSNGFLKVPNELPNSLQRFLGLETDENHNFKGLSEEEIRLSSRLMTRRGSSSSESSTSTLT